EGSLPGCEDVGAQLRVESHVEAVIALQSCLVENRDRRSSGFYGNPRILRRRHCELKCEKIGELAHVAGKTESRAGRRWISSLIRLDARAVFANFQCVYAHLLAFAMLLQLKAVDEKRAQHQLNLLPRRAFGNSGRDVVFLAVEPRRPGDLAGLAVPCFRNETAERDAFSVEAVGRVG